MNIPVLPSMLSIKLAATCGDTDLGKPPRSLAGGYVPHEYLPPCPNCEFWVKRSEAQNSLISD